MTKFFHEFYRDESGAAAAEYALILAIVGAAIGAAAFLLGNQVKTSIVGAAQKVKDCSATATTGCTAAGVVVT
jgi:pilus assembly protein Flp/PilA